MKENNPVKKNCTIYDAEESLLEELRHTYPIEEKDSDSIDNNEANIPEV